MLFAIFITSCNENQPPIYDSVNGQTLVYFANTSSSLAIEIDATGQNVIPINATTKSTVDRTVTVEVVAESTTADPQNYTYNASVVIPAGEYTGNLVVNGVDVTAETTPKTVVFKITSFSDSSAIISATKHSVSVFQFCPIDADKFIGNYLIVEQTPFVDGPTLSNNTVVEVKFVNPTRRVFSTKNYPNYCSPFRNFYFDLICNEVIIPKVTATGAGTTNPGQSSTCACTSGGLFFGPATTPSSYDPNNDSEFFLTFTNDVTGDCGPAVQTTYKFTKQ